MNVFDRTAKIRQKNRAYASPDAQTYDYIRNEVDQKYFTKQQTQKNSLGE